MASLKVYLKSLLFNSVLLSAFGLCAVLLPTQAVADVLTQDSADQEPPRQLVKLFGGELKTALQSAIKAGGPVNAVEVCHHEAGPIGERISAQSGWDIRRTALKVRNQNNAPDDWEKTTLLQFEQRHLAGENIADIEQSAILTQGGQSVYRYMKAIPTEGLCLTCHGSRLDHSVVQKLKTLYPHDQAVGFSVGDIRGAFSLQKIITE